MKTAPEKTYDTEPLVLPSFIACVQYQLTRILEEQRVVSVIVSVVQQFDGKKADAKFSKAMSAALPEYRALLESRGVGPFQSWYVYIRPTTSYDIVASEEILMHTGTHLIDASNISAMAARRKAVSDEYIASYQAALKDAPELVAEHNAALIAMQTVHARIGHALHAVQTSRR